MAMKLIVKPEHVVYQLNVIGLWWLLVNHNQEEIMIRRDSKSASQVWSSKQEWYWYTTHALSCTLPWKRKNADTK